MLRGLLLGSVSGLCLSVLLVGTMSLIAPPPGSQTHRPVAARPDAPVLREQADAAPRVPDALPGRGSAQAVPETPASEASAAPVDDRLVDDRLVEDSLVADAEVAPAEAPPVNDGAAAVPLPVASAFNRPREDGEVVTPGSDPVSRPSRVTDGLRVASSVPRDGPLTQTQSPERPLEARVEGFGAAPEAGRGPDVPRTLADDPPQTSWEAPPADVPQLVEEVAVVIDTEAPARPPSAAANAGSALLPAETDPAEPDPAEAGRQASEYKTSEADGTEARLPVAPVEDADRAIPPSAAQPDPPGASSGADAGTASGTAPRCLTRACVQAASAGGGADDAPKVFKVGALTTQAAVFDNPDDLPLLAIVLIEDPEGGLSRDSLAALDFPVTIALDPEASDVAGAARTYRAAGHEVVMQAAALAPDGAPRDIEVAVEEARDALPQALGVLDVAEGSFASDRSALAALLPALSEAGMGWLAYPAGLYSVIGTARRNGVPALRVPPALDEDDARPAAVSAALTEASIDAVRDGAAVVVGHARPETIAAIETWRRGEQSGHVVVAPVSAVLTGFGS